MAESIARPWILKHLLEIAATRGANVHDAPPFKRKRKVQITRFLTFPAQEQPDDIIWALISDKQYEIPVKFTSTAVAAYNRANAVFGAAEDERRLTTRRLAVVIIGNFKAFSARVPLGNGRGMTTDERIAFEVDDFDVLGAEHEDIFGNPANIETHEDIREWISGLREGGGGGNVLMHPKEDTAAMVSPVQQQIIAPPENSVIPSRGVPEQKAIVSSTAPSPKEEDEPKTPVDLLKDYTRMWKAVDRIWYVAPPVDVQLQHDQILRFGKESQDIKRDALDVDFVEDSIVGDDHDDYEPAEPTIEQVSESIGGAVTKSGVAQAHEVDLIHTPLSSPVKGKGSKKNGPVQSTPSQWADSDGEWPDLKRKIREEDEDNKVAAASLSKRRRTRSGGVLPPTCEEKAVGEDDENEDDVTVPSEDEGSEHIDRNEKCSGRSDGESDEGSSFPAPTPAQRQKQHFGTESSMSQSRFHLSQLEPSQSVASDLPISLPSATFPYRVPSKRFDYSHNVSLTLGTLQSESQHEGLHSSHLRNSSRFSSQEKPIESTPRILVPDSDTSGRLNSQSQSQSQSQVDEHSLERGLLDGFSNDLTLHRELEGPHWLNWNDAMRILLNMGRRRNVGKQ